MEMPRKRLTDKEDSVSLSAIVPKHIKEKLREKARREKRTVSNVTYMILEQYINAEEERSAYGLTPEEQNAKKTTRKTLQSSRGASSLKKAGSGNQ